MEVDEEGSSRKQIDPLMMPLYQSRSVLDVCGE